MSDSANALLKRGNKKAPTPSERSEGLEGGSNSEGANLELELAYCRTVEVGDLLAELDVPALEISEDVTVQELVDHVLENQAGVLDFGVDLAVECAAVLGEEDAVACQETELLAETVKLAFRHRDNPGSPGRKNRVPSVRSAECTAERGQ